MATFTVTSNADTDTTDGTTGRIGTGDLAGSPVGTLRQAINYANSIAEPLTIDFASGLDPIQLNGPLQPILNSVTINGNGATIDGQNATRIFFVGVDQATAAANAGTNFGARIHVALDGLTLDNGTAQGGTGGSQGGGGLGAGGAIFVNQSADVTLSDVDFTENSAIGGTANVDGGDEGGGGLGGNAGISANGLSGGGGLYGQGGADGGGGGGGVFGNGGDGEAGGGGGYSGNGGSGAPATAGTLSIFDLSASGGNGSTGAPGGAHGGGGGVGGTALEDNGGGGGFGGSTPGNVSPSDAGSGGFGGGGGDSANLGNGGNGGFGGGGGVADHTGGNGGFGGGGGGGDSAGGNGGFGGGGGGASTTGGNGGFGGGAGVNSRGKTGTPGFGASGVDGAGLGGAIFVAAGGTLEIDGTSTEGLGTATQGGAAAGTGGFGGGIFEEGGAAGTNVSTLRFGAGNQSYADTIADLNGSAGDTTTGNGLGAIGGATAIMKSGSGTLLLSASNTYTGGTTISSGTLELGTNTSAGSGPITFGTAPATLRLDQTLHANSDTDFTDSLALLAVGDQIDVKGLPYAASTTSAVESADGSQLVVTDGQDAETFSLTGATATLFTTSSDGAGGTPGTLITAIAPPVIGIPTANAQTSTTAETIPDPILLTGTDPDSPALPLTFAITAQPTGGTLSGFDAATGAVTYTPNAGTVGPDSFAFTDTNGTNTSAPATVTIAVTAPPGPSVVSPPPAPIAVTAPPTNNAVTPTLAFDRSVSVSGNLITLSGTTTPGSAVEVFANMGAAQHVDLGAAAVDPTTGAWTLASDDFTRGFHNGIMATATLGGVTTTTDSGLDLTTGLGPKHMGFTTILDEYDTATDNFLGSTFIKGGGGIFAKDHHTDLPDGGERYTYTGGSILADQSVSSFSASYIDGNLTGSILHNDDGTTTIENDAKYQVVNSHHDDTIVDYGSHTRFIFHDGAGHEAISGFKLDSDTISVPAADAAHLAKAIQVYDPATNGFDTTVFTGQGFSITFMGIRKEQLLAHAADFSVHA